MITKVNIYLSVSCAKTIDAALLSHAVMDHSVFINSSAKDAVLKIRCNILSLSFPYDAAYSATSIA